MYIAIFSVVFITIVRPLLANKTQKLKYSEMPRTKVMQIILDAMKYARKEGDLVREELLFGRMLDLMRDPNLVCCVSDQALRYREENIYHRFKTNKE